MPEKTIAQSLSKSYRKAGIDKQQFDTFKQQLSKLYAQLAVQDSEAKLKEDLMDFLKYTFYGQQYKVSPHGSIDFAIHLGDSVEDPVGVLFEIKTPSNASEMAAHDNINRKAMQELLLYYLRERVGNRNIELKHLVITDGNEFFIFDAHEFERMFFSNKQLVKDFVKFSEGRMSSGKTDFFYKEVASPAIETVKDRIGYTWFDIRKFKTPLDHGNDKPLKDLYKVLSPEHLLKRPFQTDSNSLNTKFYSELLYILGLEEVDDKGGGRRIIIRRPEKRRCSASLIENAIGILEAEDWMEHIHNSEQYGESREEQTFNVALALCISWINRILFLKLLEAQLVNYHKGNRNYAFLQPDSITDFGELNKLFFRVLAKRPGERSADVNRNFSNVPYLNSSLFEMSELERETIRISNLDKIDFPLYSETVLKVDGKLSHKALPTLRYILEFLDSYDFSGEGSDETQESAKPLVNASVLGLIFEKINGYKDGSVFTPAAITMYMSREAVRATVVRRFNEEMGWNCPDYEALKDKDIDDLKRANAIMDSIRICDPSVGSGHFLVSVLNEIIFTKHDLGILLDCNGKRIKKQNWSIDVENDELMVSDAEGDPFVYIPGNPERQRIQEALFNEKRKVIENCIFGVDINTNAVGICRLRLWIELLKNAYYTKDSGYRDLETLPNIDINIKTGNSLVYRFPLSQDISAILKDDISIKSYKEAVATYKGTGDKQEKRRMEAMIRSIKSAISTRLSGNEPEAMKKSQLQKERNDLLDYSVLFGVSDKERERREKKAAELQGKIDRLDKEIEKIKNRFAGAMEWRIEFPEILDSNGKFVGFDCIIGNPPYIQLQSMGAEADVLKKMGHKTYDRTGDIYCLFYEVGMNLLKPEAMLSFITSNKWMRADYGRKLRGLLSAEYDPCMLIDFANNKVFDRATVFVNILTLIKRDNHGLTASCTLGDKFDLAKLGEFIEKEATSDAFTTSGPWVALSDVERTIKEKIESVGTPLKSLTGYGLYRGVLTGFNEAFVITTEKRNEILRACADEEECKRTEELIQPIISGRDIHRNSYDWPDTWIITTFPSRHFEIDMYHSLKEYLLSFGKERLEQSGAEHVINGMYVKSRKKSSNKWFETSDNTSYWKEFAMPKIAWGNLNKSASYALVPENVFINAPACMIVPGNNSLLAILNSKVADHYVKSLGVARSGGYIEYKPMFVGQIPIPPITEEFTSEVERILSSSLPPEGKDALLETLVEDLYGLNSDEREFLQTENQR